MSVRVGTPFDRYLPEVVGIFDAVEDDYYPRWAVEAQCTDMILGGAPKNPDVLLGWLRSRFDEDEDVRQKLLEHVQQQGIDVTQDATIDQVWEQLKSLGNEQHGNGFMKDDHGIFMPGRCVKANIKEATSIRFPYPAFKWGKTTKTSTNKEGATSSTESGGKTPWKAVAERVFVEDFKVYMQRRNEDGALVPLTEPDGTMVHIGHPDGPRGPVSTLTYFDYCVQPVLTFTVRSHPDYPTEQDIRDILIKGQQLGFWAGRSMSYGQFKITEFRRL